jgi:hypothetical protein
MPKITKDAECKLTKEDCDKLEELRISLWDNAFGIEKNADNIVNNIDKLINMIIGTKQDSYHTSYLMDMRRTATFLESTHRARVEKLEKDQPESLYDKKDREYRKIGFFNNIIHKVGSDCGCSDPGEKTPKDRLVTFTIIPKR